MTIIKAQNKVDDHAAYGALVLKGVEQLSALLGMDAVTDSGDKSSLHEIANLFDVRSPLVMAKLGGTKPSECNSKER